jgi:PiT family inorganic phosphate transporter
LLEVCVLLVAVACVAFTNGANANFKGVASLYGSGTTSLKTALNLGNGFTFAGSLMSYWLASGLLKSFGGRGLLSDSVVQAPFFAASVALAAAGTSFLATRFSFPVSTTHALVGALAGCGVANSLFGSLQTDIRWNNLFSSFMVPMLLSPVLAIVLALVLFWVISSSRFVSNEKSFIRDSLHFGSAGAASFARGLNDTPKMVAIVMLLPDVNVPSAFLFVAFFMLLGGLFDARNVAETLGKKIAELSPAEGLAASLVTSILVITASLKSLPVSTTQVSVGAIAGMGWVNRKTHWKMLGEIVLAWFTTVPCGLLFGLIIYGCYLWIAVAI